MEDLENIFPKKLYHSYIIEGNPAILSREIIKFLKKRGELEDKSPNLLFQEYESFGIKDGILIKEWHSKLALGDKKKFCVLSTKFINKEAEQSLLKIIEEPSLDTHIFIIVPDSSALLDTILSRVQVVKISDKEKKNARKTAEAFISLKPKDRLFMIENFIKENTEENNSGKLRYETIKLINELENIYYSKFKTNMSQKKNRIILEELKKNRNFLKQPGSSAKYILQNMALII